MDNATVITCGKLPDAADPANRDNVGISLADRPGSSGVRAWLKRYERVLLYASIVFLLIPHSNVFADGAELRCRSIIGLAEAKAQLLYGPSVRLLFSHQPYGGDDSPEQTLGNAGYGIRALVSFSPLDLVRAGRILNAAEAECAAVRAAEPVADLVLQGVQYGRASALRAQIAFIELQTNRVDELLEASRQRRERQINTVLEEDELLLRALRLRRVLAAARQELAVLDAQDFNQEVSPTNWDSVEGYEQQILELERVDSTLRRLSAWDVSLQLGPVPGDEWDWYGQVALTVDLGGVGQVRAEQRYLAARADDIRGHDEDLRMQLTELRETLEVSAAEFVHELELVDEQLTVIARERTQIQERSGSGWQHLDAALEFDAMLFEAERAYLQRLYELRDITSPENGTGL